MGKKRYKKESKELFYLAWSSGLVSLTAKDISLEEIEKIVTLFPELQIIAWTCDEIGKDRHHKAKFGSGSKILDLFHYNNRFLLIPDRNKFFQIHLCPKCPQFFQLPWLLESTCSPVVIKFQMHGILQNYMLGGSFNDEGQ